MLEKAILGMVCSIALSGDASSGTQGYNAAQLPAYAQPKQECILDKENWRTLLKGYNSSIPVGQVQSINKPVFRKGKKPTGRYFRHR